MLTICSTLAICTKTFCCRGAGGIIDKFVRLDSPGGGGSAGREGEVDDDSSFFLGVEEDLGGVFNTLLTTAFDPWSDLDDGEGEADACRTAGRFSSRS